MEGFRFGSKVPQEQSHLMETETAQTRTMQKVLFIVRGHVRSVSRVVSPFLPQKVSESDYFQIQFLRSVELVKGDVDPKSLQWLHDKVKQYFTVDRLYTTKLGDLCTFVAPIGPWWVAIQDVSWRVYHGYDPCETKPIKGEKHVEEDGLRSPQVVPSEAS